MGIYDRDYYRNTNTLQWWSQTGVVCRWLITVNIVVFLLQLFFPRECLWLYLAPEETLGQFQIWRIVTYAFCHDTSSLLHILFNMLFLWWFGKHLEGMYGSKEFLRFYLTAAVLSGMAFLALAYAIGDPSPAIGASGGVMAVMMLYTLYYPREQIYVMFVIPVELRWLLTAYVVFNLLPVLSQLGGGQNTAGVANAAHLGGLLYGFCYKWYDLRYDRLLGNRNTSWSDSWKQWRRRHDPARRNVRLYHPPENHSLDQEVDRILAKITAEGEASLTDTERQVLKTASQKYRQR
jgi:membrane associated rhomboid family serine protease